MDFKHKKVQKSFRISEDLIQYLEENFEGKNLTDKLEAMIRYCILEKPQLDREINFHRKQLSKLKKDISSITSLQSRIQSIQYHLNCIDDMLK